MTTLLDRYPSLLELHPVDNRLWLCCWTSDPFLHETQPCLQPSRLPIPLISPFAKIDYVCHCDHEWTSCYASCILFNWTWLGIGMIQNFFHDKPLSSSGYHRNIIQLSFLLSFFSLDLQKPMTWGDKCRDSLEWRRSNNWNKATCGTHHVQQTVIE